MHAYQVLRGSQQEGDFIARSSWGGCNFVESAGDAHVYVRLGPQEVTTLQQYLASNKIGCLVPLAGVSIKRDPHQRDVLIVTMSLSGQMAYETYDLKTIKDMVMGGLGKNLNAHESQPSAAR